MTALEQLVAEKLREAVTDRWQPLPWQEKAIADTKPVVLLTGTVGSGKTRTWIEMVHNFCSTYPGAFWLVARKTRESMTEGAMLQLADAAVGHATHAGSALVYDNGSRVAYVGMKDAIQRTRIRSVGRSGDVDGVVMEEATEFNESDHNELRARLRGKAGPYRQMIIATNPDAPTHWIYQRMIVGDGASVHTAHTADNVHLPKGYREEQLEGVTDKEYQRLVLGKWVAAEGVVHDNWDAAVNLVDRFELDPGWRRIGAIDFGQEHPTVVQWWAVDGDGRMILCREIYKTRMALEDLAELCKQYNDADKDAGVLRPARFYYDHAAGVRLRGVPCVGANKAVEPGLKVVNQRLRKAGDGRPRMVLFRDARVHPADPRQVAAHRPTQTSEEFASYVWSVRADGWNRDLPEKRDDDGMDCCRYAAMAAERSGAKFATFKVRER